MTWDGWIILSSDPRISPCHSIYPARTRTRIRTREKAVRLRLRTPWPCGTERFMDLSHRIEMESGMETGTETGIRLETRVTGVFRICLR